MATDGKRRGTRQRRGLPPFALAVAAVVLALTPGAGAQTSAPAPTAGTATDYSVSPEVRDLSAHRRLRHSGDQAPPRINPLGAAAEGQSPGRAGGDALGGPASENSGRTPAPTLTFEGIGNPTACGGCSPPDTIGDVGPNHYIQMVNATKVAIYNKSGVLQTPVFDLGTLWPVSSDCADNAGDPVVLYDEAADRWLLSQFTLADSLCFAISQTADPTGAYHLFEFSTPDFPDYFKVGVWPSGYYVSANESSYTAYAFNRTKMLAGDATASFVRFSGQTNFLMPADVDGPTQPTGGGLFYTFKDGTFHGGADRIELFRLTPDFAVPGNSTFTLINTFPITSFEYTVCGFFNLNCIPQSGTAQKVDPVSEWPMQRLAYRQFGDHEALVGNFTVKSHTTTATTAGAGIRWFELRNTGAGWSLFQEGTHDPNDGIDRFMGSIAIDKAGNIALGYSASSGSIFPSMRYATRAPGDAAGTLQAEQVMQAGGGSQTGSNRWGDYSAMSVDPANDCTFWYTNEYYPVSASSTWKTRIGNFVVPGCVGPPAPVFSASPPSVSFGNQNVGTTSAPQTVTVTNVGDANLTISSVALVTGNAGDFNLASNTCSGATLTPSQTCTVGPRFAPTAAGARATVLRFSDNASGSPHDVPLSGTGITPTPTFSASPASVNFGNQDAGTTSAPQTVTVTNTGAANLTITSVALATGNTADFSIGSDGCTGQTLAPAGTCAVGSRFAPTTTGARATELRFTDNASGSPHDVHLSGNGTDGSGPPSNNFTFGKVKRNTKKGTATLTVDVPGPGEIALGGTGVKPQRPVFGFRGRSKPVAAAGPVKLKIKATGKKKQKLNETGKVKVKVKVTFTPTGGAPNTESKKVKLKRVR